MIRSGNMLEITHGDSTLSIAILLRHMVTKPPQKLFFLKHSFARFVFSANKGAAMQQITLS